MAATNAIPMAYAPDIIAGARARTSPRAVQARPVRRNHTPTRSIGLGKQRQEAKTPRPKMICQRPGSIQKTLCVTRSRTNAE